jgi:tRNA G10  N-methylase Trm11
MKSTLPENKYGVHHLYPYKGAMHPGLARRMIELAKPDQRDMILDPFCGSGTILVESVMAGLDAVGIDLLPLAVVASRVKTNFAPGDEPNLEEEATKLQQIMSCAESLEEAHAEILARHNEMRQLVEKREIALGSSRLMVGSILDRKLPCASHIVTSPPYGDLIDYVDLSARALTILGYPREKIQKIREGMMTDNAHYQAHVARVAAAFAEAIPDEGKVVLAVGPDKQVHWERVWIVRMTEAGFNLLRRFTHSYQSLANEIEGEEIQCYGRRKD